MFQWWIYFLLNEKVNRHNGCYWFDVSPHVFRKCDTEYPQKINIYAGMLGNDIVGPIFLEKTKTNWCYVSARWCASSLLQARSRVVEWQFFKHVDVRCCPIERSVRSPSKTTLHFYCEDTESVRYTPGDHFKPHR